MSSMSKLPLWIVPPNQQAQIVNMIADGTISRASGRRLLDILIEQNLARWASLGISEAFLRQNAEQFDEMSSLTRSQHET